MSIPLLKLVSSEIEKEFNSFLKKNNYKNINIECIINYENKIMINYIIHDYDNNQTYEIKTSLFEGHLNIFYNPEYDINQAILDHIRNNFNKYFSLLNNLYKNNA